MAVRAAISKAHGVLWAERRTAEKLEQKKPKSKNN
jgi:hypothetical protein